LILIQYLIYYNNKLFGTIFFADLIRRVRISNVQKGLHKMNRDNSTTTVVMVPSLTLVDSPVETGTEKKENLVMYQLKVRAGAEAATAEKYKVHVRRFDDGTPQALINLLIKLNEIWTQNTVDEPVDRLAIIRTLFRGEALSLFESALATARDDPDGGEELALTNEHLEEGIQEVKRGVFPHRALEIQKLWMRRKMRKPVDLTFRKMVTAVTRINNYIPYFPDATDADKFQEAEIIELLEWSIPQKWRNQFDLEGYVPSLFNRATLLGRCEAFERQEPNATKPQVHKANSKKSAKHKHTKPSNSTEKFYCTEHGADKKHNTDSCWTLINRAKKAKENSGKKLTPNKFRKELNSVATGRNKLKTIAKYSKILKSEQKKAQKAKTKASSKQKKADSESDPVSSGTDSDLEVHVLETVHKKAVKPKAGKPKTVTFSDINKIEEKNTLKANTIGNADLFIGCTDEDSDDDDDITNVNTNVVTNNNMVAEATAEEILEESLLDAELAKLGVTSTVDNMEE